MQVSATALHASFNRFLYQLQEGPCTKRPGWPLVKAMKAAFVEASNDGCDYDALNLDVAVIR